MTKLVVTDVDGTLVKESTLNINPEYYDVIRALHAKGIRVVLASGRQYESIRKLIEPVQDLVWYIADGGATLKMDRGLAVATAHPKIKAAADGIIPSYTEDGVLQEWKKLL